MLNLIEKMLNFNGMDSGSDFSVAGHHNSIYGNSVTSTLGNDQTSCQVGTSFSEHANYISKPMQVVHSARATLPSDNKNEFGVHCGANSYIGSENVKRFSVNNLLKLANCGVDRVNGKRSVDNMPLSIPSTNEIQPTPKKSNSKTNKLFTRTRVYGAIKKNSAKMGYNGTSCLLKIICETAEVPVNPNNGLLGSIFHVVFTPSSSEDEGLPNDFYNAENSGALGDCAAYNSHCPNNIIKVHEPMTAAQKYDPRLNYK